MGAAHEPLLLLQQKEAGLLAVAQLVEAVEELGLAEEVLAAPAAVQSLQGTVCYFCIVRLIEASYLRTRHVHMYEEQTHLYQTATPGAACHGSGRRPRRRQRGGPARLGLQLDTANYSSDQKGRLFTSAFQSAVRQRTFSDAVGRRSRGQYTANLKCSDPAPSHCLPRSIGFGYVL